MTTNWKEYYEKIGNSSPRPLLVEAVKKCERHVAVLDIGAGSMADSIYLLQKILVASLLLIHLKVFLKSPKRHSLHILKPTTLK
jgi:hypothetical protein